MCRYLIRPPSAAWFVLDFSVVTLRPLRHGPFQQEQFDMHALPINKWGLAVPEPD